MTKTMTDNILNVFDLATDDEITQGTYWYNEANALAWRLDPFNYLRACGVIAALSPRLRWDKNVEYATLAYNLKGYPLDVLVNDVPGGNYIPTMGMTALKALKMVNGGSPRDILGRGLKTNAFFDNIANPYTSERVTVDKHAFDIAMGERTGYNTVIKDAVYHATEKAYVEAAWQVGKKPSQLQAICWVAWRNMNRER